jgi:predicted MFS family arabinose efflux permease
MAKRLGRFLTLMSMAGVSFSFAFVSAFATNFWFFIFCRGMLGFSGGILLPVGCSILVEMVPTKHRTKVIAFIVNGGVGWIAGELFAISLAYVFLENL